MGETLDASPVRRLGTWAALAMVASEVVGVGIFLTPATMARTLGSVWASLLVWGAMAALSIAGALCYAELATRWPRAGGVYVFLREGFGLRCAFVYGWMMLLVVDPGLVAALAVGLSRYLIEVLGSPAGRLVPLAIACIVSLALITLLGMHASARLMEWTAVIKLAAVVWLVCAGLARASGADAIRAWPDATSSGIDLEALATAMVAAFFAFGGWWELGRMSEEVVSPRRTIPRALIGGLALVAAIYAAVTVAFMLATSGASAASDEGFVRAVGAAILRTDLPVLPALVVIAVSGTLAAVLLRTPRGYVAMARDGVLPQRFARLDPRRGTCALATIVQATLASGCVLLGSFDEILAYFVPASVFFVGLAAAVLFRLQRPALDDVTTFRMPWYPLPVYLFLAAVIGVLIVVAAGHPRPTLLGAGVVAVAMVASRLVVSGEPAMAPASAAQRRSPTVHPGESVLSRGGHA